MPKFRKKPVVVEATKITRVLEIKTREGTMRGEVGDWLITGVAGEQYPCKPEIFEATYVKTGGSLYERRAQNLRIAIRALEEVFKGTIHEDRAAYLNRVIDALSFWESNCAGIEATDKDSK